METGWITLHRKIRDHWVWGSKPFSYGQAWVDILMECNHSERKQLINKTLVVTKRGQSSNSLKTWSYRWGWSITATRHFLELLKNDRMIDTESVRVTTRLTVCNYDTYQSKPHANDTEVISQEDSMKISLESQEIDKQQLNNTNNGNNGNNEVLRAHEAYRLISSRKPLPYDLAAITEMVGDHGVDKVINALAVCGRYKWDKIYQIDKVISGEWPKGDQDKKAESQTFEEAQKFL